MTLVALILDALVRLRHRFGECPHWMVEQPGGPACDLCPKAWAWKRRLNDDD